MLSSCLITFIVVLLIVLLCFLWVTWIGSFQFGQNKALNASQTPCVHCALERSNVKWVGSILSDALYAHMRMYIVSKNGLAMFMGMYCRPIYSLLEM